MVSTLRTPCAADQLLIEEVRQHEVLYACPTKSNKDNQLRDSAWQEIADAVGKSGKSQQIDFDSFIFLNDGITFSFILSRLSLSAVQSKKPRSDGDI